MLKRDGRSNCPARSALGARRYLAWPGAGEARHEVIMPFRPENICRSCDYTWSPRGHNISRRCPHCGSSAVEVHNPLGDLLASMAASKGCWIVFGGMFAAGIVLAFCMGFLEMVGVLPKSDRNKN